MFTLLWTGNEVDGWDRISSKDEVERKIRKLIKEGFFTEDMLVFSPRVDYIVPEDDGSIA